MSDAFWYQPGAPMLMGDHSTHRPQPGMSFTQPSDESLERIRSRDSGKRHVWNTNGLAPAPMKLEKNAFSLPSTTIRNSTGNIGGIMEKKMQAKSALYVSGHKVISQQVSPMTVSRMNSTSDDNVQRTGSAESTSKDMEAIDATSSYTSSMAVSRINSSTDGVLTTPNKGSQMHSITHPAATASSTGGDQTPQSSSDVSRVPSAAISESVSAARVRSNPNRQSSKTSAEPKFVPSIYAMGKYVPSPNAVIRMPPPPPPKPKAEQVLASNSKSQLAAQTSNSAGRMHSFSLGETDTSTKVSEAEVDAEVEAEAGAEVGADDDPAVNHLSAYKLGSSLPVKSRSRAAITTLSLDEEIAGCNSDAGSLQIPLRISQKKKPALRRREMLKERLISETAPRAGAEKRSSKRQPFYMRFNLRKYGTRPSSILDDSNYQSSDRDNVTRMSNNIQHPNAEPVRARNQHQQGKLSSVPASTFAPQHRKGYARAHHQPLDIIQISDSLQDDMSAADSFYSFDSNKTPWYMLLRKSRARNGAKGKWVPRRKTKKQQLRRSQTIETRDRYISELESMEELLALNGGLAEMLDVPDMPEIPMIEKYTVKKALVFDDEPVPDTMLVQMLLEIAAEPESAAMSFGPVRTPSKSVIENENDDDISQPKSRDSDGSGESLFKRLNTSTFQLEALIKSHSSNGDSPSDRFEDVQDDTLELPRREEMKGEPAMVLPGIELSEFAAAAEKPEPVVKDIKDIKCQCIAHGDRRMGRNIRLLISIFESDAKCFVCGLLLPLVDDPIGRNVCEDVDGGGVLNTDGSNESNEEEEEEEEESSIESDDGYRQDSEHEGESGAGTEEEDHEEKDGDTDENNE